jgi:uncharacterized protein (AIM24 family)
MLHNFANLPAKDNINRFSFSIQIDNKLFFRKGKMIAYYGLLSFEDLGRGVIDMFLQEAFNSPLYSFDYAVVAGKGKLILADNYNDVTSVEITEQSITIKAENLLAFEPGLELQQSILAGYLTLKGSGTFIASSVGPIHMLNPPVRVDPRALVGWIDMPSPSYYYDMNLKSLFGYNSGEEKQVDFYGNSEGIILLQSSEDSLHVNEAYKNLMFHDAVDRLRSNGFNDLSITKGIQQTIFPR